MLRAEMRRRHDQCGRIHAVVIDGAGDLCEDLNRPEIAFGLVDELIALSVEFDCPIVLVLHENPKGRTGEAKTRGHLGSQLERKAESNLRIEKDANEVSTIFSLNSRNASIPKASGVQFKWCPEAGMHITTDAQPKSKPDRERAMHQPAVDAVFDGVISELKFNELKVRIKEATEVSPRTAERRIPKWIELGLIEKTESGAYRKTYRQPSSTVKSTVKDG